MTPAAHMDALAPPPNPHLALLKLVRACPDGGEPGCGCDGRRSCRRLGRDVALSECLECVQADGGPRDG